MNEQNFITTLFMFIVGTIFTLLSLIVIFVVVKVPFERIYIKNTGIQVDAKVIYRSYDSLDEYPHYNYKIEYEVNGNTYSYHFESNNSTYNENDIISIYCLPDTPEKASVSIEKNSRNAFTSCNTFYAIFRNLLPKIL